MDKVEERRHRRQERIGRCIRESEVRQLQAFGSGRLLWWLLMVLVILTPFALLFVLNLRRLAAV